MAPRAPCCRGTRASLATPGQSCSRWHADDNEISNISKVGFPETDLTRLSPTRTLGKVNLLFGAGESGGRLCPGRRAKTTAWGDLPWGRRWAEVPEGVQVHACFGEMLWKAAAKTRQG